MGIKVDRCIGCGRCVDGCKKENNVPDEPFFFRTWVERYVIDEDGEVTVDSPNGGRDGFKGPVSEKRVLKSFFVPKICNQCEKPPCVQVCPVGATYKTQDGVILVDSDMVHRLPVLHPGMPVRGALSPPEDADRGEMHVLLPQDSERASPLPASRYARPRRGFSESSGR